MRFRDSYRFLSSSLDFSVKTLHSDNFEILKDQFPDKRKIAYPYENFVSLDE